MGCKFHLALKMLKVNLRPSLNKLGRPWVPDAIYQDSALLSWFLRRRFLSVFTIHGHGGHFVQWRGTIRINCQFPFDRRPHLKSVENCSSGFRRRQPTIIIWTNLVDLESPMLYTKIQPQSFLGSGKEDFKCFTMATILINEPWPFEQIFNPPLTESSTWNLKKISQGVLEENLFKYVNGRTMNGKWSQ